MLFVVILSSLLSLFQGHVACGSFVLTGPILSGSPNETGYKHGVHAKKKPGG